MSENRQQRHANRPAPIRTADPKRQSASGPGDRTASVHEVATYFREDCRALRDSLQLEMVVAQYELRIRSVVSPDGVPVGDALSAGVIAELERHDDPLSHAILRGLEYLATGTTAQRSAEAAARIAARGVALPAQFADVAEARPVGAWRETGGAGDGEYALFVDFAYRLGTRHALALFVEPRRGGVVKHLGLLSAMTELDSDDPFHPSALEPLEVATAGALMRKVLDRSFRRPGPDVDDYRVVIALARAHSMEQRGAAVGA